MNAALNVVLLCIVIALARCNPLPPEVLSNHLTDEDFERGKLLTLEQQGIYITDPVEHLRFHGNARTLVWISLKYKWPNATVPYVISPLYNTQERAIIAESIREWESKTCVRFVPATSEDRDYLELTPNDGTNNYCYSYIGRQGGRQFVKMYAPTCMSVGQYVHELGHAIGFGHEHQRPDRDTYIDVKYENIDPTFNYAFDKYSSSQFMTQGTAYDYYSIMHYPDYSYSKNGRPTLVPKVPGHQITYMNVRLSPTDVEKTKLYYNCSI